MSERTEMDLLTKATTRVNHVLPGFPELSLEAGTKGTIEPADDLKRNHYYFTPSSPDNQAIKEFANLVGYVFSESELKIKGV